ncbi:hypothetical protein BSU04_00300 [Caballeronia sordidicola]|uniref:Uncharacterized protein n=1 Tax=Caballeronia sordidicola TaxID=196367 RepID=A0A226XB57_CABSO|nr:hypothetical protein BSU04_00300 [Caballeronia sordidicola]
MNASRFATVFVCSDYDRMGCSSISGLVAALYAAAHYEIRSLAPHSSDELEALFEIQV